MSLPLRRFVSTSNLPRTLPPAESFMATRKARKSTELSSEDVPLPSFEESMSRLSQIVEELEAGDLTLEESLKRFEEGVKLARASQSRLDLAEARVELLLGIDEDGNPETEEIEDV